MLTVALDHLTLGRAWLLEAEERVAKAEMSELQDWAMRLLDARSLDEVFSPA